MTTDPPAQVQVVNPGNSSNPTKIEAAKAPENEKGKDAPDLSINKSARDLTHQLIEKNGQ